MAGYSASSSAGDPDPPRLPPEVVAAFVDGAMAHDDWLRVARHFALCDGCLAEAQSVLRTLRGTGEAGPGPESMAIS